MAAKIIDGKAVAEKIKAGIAGEVAELKKKTGKTPCLAVVLVGDDEASKVYVSMKEVACGKTGIRSVKKHLPENASEEDVLNEVKQLSDDDDVHGILVQLPLPAQVSEEKVLEAIAPEKDVDGFNPVNFGKLLAGYPSFVPATPKGVIRLLKEYGVALEGKNAVVIGRSNIVGKPTAVLLLKENATVTVSHSRTKNLSEVARQADVLVIAVGKPLFVKNDFVKKGAVVVDVGVNRLSDGSLCGDVDFNAVKEKASLITPVPGGVGPMTIACLLENTLQAFKQIEGIDSRNAKYIK